MSVHGAHCCKKHGCKYAHKDCPVVLGTEKAIYDCEECDFEKKRIDKLCKIMCKVDGEEWQPGWIALRAKYIRYAIAINEALEKGEFNDKNQ